MSRQGAAILAQGNDTEKAKEGIGSKGFMKSCQEEENMAPFDCTYASCIRTFPWERLERVSTNLVRLHAPLKLNRGQNWNFKIPAQGQAPLKAQFDLYEERTAETQGHTSH
ncbi:hypothetical protein PIB30_084182 [Stylosanthes scabra]|uniref:Uncharacterized protein n=1 Tax=Stylosanthes scabra TaxID=79078 RepID=A0ABU6TVA9_9FABA|nr:hypothetical protein [Stylosanthes scabra]